MNYKIIEIQNPKTKGEICRDIINDLPEWFGISSANEAYAKQVEAEKFLVIQLEERICGFISTKKHNAQSAEITVMGLYTAFHRSGFGRKLVSSMEGLLKAEGIEYLSVKTLADTRECPEYERTRRFYKGVGFIELEVIPEIWGPDNPCLYMVKKI